MKEQTRQGADRRSGLNIGETIVPVEKHSIGWRTELTKAENVSPETRTSPFCFFLEVNSSRAWFCFNDCPQVTLVGIQSSRSQGDMVLHELFGGRKIMLGCTRGHQGHGKGQTTWSTNYYSTKFCAIIPLVPRRIIAFLHNFGVIPPAWALRNGLK